MAEPVQYIGLLPYRLVSFPLTGGDTITLARHQVVSVEELAPLKTRVKDSNNQGWKVALSHADVLLALEQI